MLKNTMKTIGAAAAVALGLLAQAAPASAHASLVSASPVNGAQVAVIPAEAVLTFSEAVKPVVVKLTGADGREVGTIAAVRTDGTNVIVPLPADLAEGVYAISYSVVSGDAHPAQGAVTFTFRKAD